MKSIEGFRSNIEKHQQATDEKRNLILSILRSTSGKREAKDYLKKYSLLKDVQPDSKLIDYNDINDFRLSIAEQKTKYDKIIDNLIQGDNYESKELGKPLLATDSELELTDTLRIAIIKIRDFENLSKKVVDGIGLTIYSIIRLGVTPIIVIDNDEELIKNNGPIRTSFSQLTHKLFSQSNILMDAINESTKDKNHQTETRSVRGLFEIGENGLSLTLPETLLIPLSQRIIPIVYPIAYNLQTSKQDLLTSSQVLNCLVDDLLKCNDALDNEKLLTIEKLIFIDPEGGIPSLERFKSSHVLINLLQEYEDIQSELYIGFLRPAVRDIHLKNLSLMRELLSKLPHSTGVITTPEIATLENKRRYTNPIIYNVLTDRPVISSSLPVNLNKTPLLNTTIIKNGIPIKIVNFKRGAHLRDHPEIDLTKLTTLLNESFKRTLDLEDYLSRINEHVLCIIIAGDYQGAAIVTLELSGVPYLDKFAVNPSVQGSSGVADIVFKSILNQFSDRIIWRSRTTNPINKWYFERSKFNLHIPNSNWRLFYAGSRNVEFNELQQYIDVCANIQPSWLD